jgi:hypothetical protein
MNRTSEGAVMRLSRGFALFALCFAVVEHLLVLYIASALMPLAVGWFCLLELVNVAFAVLLFLWLQRIQPNRVLPVLLTAAAALMVPWSMLGLAWWKLPHGGSWLVGLPIPYLVVGVLAAVRPRQ